MSNKEIDTQVKALLDIKEKVTTAQHVLRIS